MVLITSRERHEGGPCEDASAETPQNQAMEVKVALSVSATVDNERLAIGDLDDQWPSGTGWKLVDINHQVFSAHVRSLGALQTDDK